MNIPLLRESPSVLFCASDGKHLRIYQVVCNAKTLLASQYSTSKVRDNVHRSPMMNDRQQRVWLTFDKRYRYTTGNMHYRYCLLTFVWYVVLFRLSSHIQHWTIPIRIHVDRLRRQTAMRHV
jgi:hypothetical protein